MHYAVWERYTELYCVICILYLMNFVIGNIYLSVSFLLFYHILNILLVRGGLKQEFSPWCKALKQCQDFSSIIPWYTFCKDYLTNQQMAFQPIVSKILVLIKKKETFVNPSNKKRVGWTICLNMPTRINSKVSNWLGAWVWSFSKGKDWNGKDLKYMFCSNVMPPPPPPLEIELKKPHVVSYM